MKKSFFVTLEIFLVFLIVSTVFSGEKTGRSIMEDVENRDDGKSMSSTMKMILIDKHNKQRIRNINSYSIDMGEDTFAVMFFKSPADVRNTGFLTYDYDDSEKDDDQWLYLPALSKTKRIASTDKSRSFMGSDLNYSDMVKQDLDDYDYTVVKETEVRGKDVWVIEAVPKTRKTVEETGYSKALLFVRKDINYVVRGISWTSEGGFIKYMDVRKLKKVDGIWVGTELHMTKKKGKDVVHKTVLKLTDIRMNPELDKDLFTLRRLEKGV